MAKTIFFLAQNRKEGKKLNVSSSDQGGSVAGVGMIHVYFESYKLTKQRNSMEHFEGSETGEGIGDLWRKIFVFPMCQRHA